MKTFFIYHYYIVILKKNIWEARSNHPIKVPKHAQCKVSLEKQEQEKI